MYSVSLFDENLNQIKSYSFDDKNHAIDFFNATVKSHSSGLFCHFVKHIELIRDNNVLAECEV